MLTRIRLGLLTLVLLTCSVGFAEESPNPADTSANCPESRVNHPPEFAKWLTAGHQRRTHPNQALEVTLDATDQDGDPLHYQADALPVGAKLDEKRGIFSWTPTPAQLGDHKIRVAVSDGRAVANADLLVEVAENQAPTIGQAPFLLLNVHKSDDDPSGVWLARDSDRDVLSVRSLTVPPGAKVVATGYEVALKWRPTDADVGEHPLVFELSDGQNSVTVTKTVVVLPARDRSDWERALLPGVGATSFLSHGDGELLLGGAFDVTFFA